MRHVFVLTVSTQIHGVGYVVDLVLNDMFYAIQVQDMFGSRNMYMVQTAWPSREEQVPWLGGG